VERQIILDNAIAVVLAPEQANSTPQFKIHQYLESRRSRNFDALCWKDTLGMNIVKEEEGWCPGTEIKGAITLSISRRIGGGLWEIDCRE